MNILLIEDNPGDVIRFKELLSGIRDDDFKLEIVASPALGLSLLSQQKFDVVVCNLFPNDSSGTEAIIRVYKAAGSTPVIVLTDNTNEESGREALKLGAQDYLHKDELNSWLLKRSLHNAVYRKQFLNRLTRNELQDSFMYKDFTPGKYRPKEEENFPEKNNQEFTQKKPYSFLQELIDNISSPIFYKNKELIYTGCNKAFAEYIGHPVEKIIGSSVLEISPLELAVVYHDADSRLLQSGGKQIYEAKVKFSDGTLHDVIFNKSVFNDSHGNPDGIVGLIIDVTDKKKTLERLEFESTFNEGLAELSEYLLQPGQSLHSISNLILKYAIKFTGANDGYAGTIDRETDELLIHSFTEMVYESCKLGLPEFRFGKKNNIYPKLWGHSLNTRKAFFTNKPNEHHSSDGTPENHININNFLSVPTIIEGVLVGQIALANSENGFSDEHLRRVERLSYLFAIAIQKHQFVHDLLMAKEKAEQSDKLKSAFLANMSHEIRTPLNAIVGFSEMLAESELNQEETKQFRTIIYQNSELLLKLISDIIEMAMIEAGELKIKTQETQIDGVALEAFNYFALNDSFLSQKQQINFLYVPDPEIGNSRIETDPIRLPQILKNLIHNAFRFTKSGHIHFGYKKPGANQIEFFVEDTGIGISKEQQKYIFDKFRQVDELSVRPYSGTGLGLTITKKLVERLNGTISVDSEPGKGATFRIVFPLIENGEKNLVVKKSQLPDKKFELNGMTFLIVEDNLSSFEFLKILLKNKNCTVIHAKDGNEAIQKFMDNPGIEIILMDLQLPEMDGYKAIEAIRKLDKKIPVIVQTAYSTNIERHKALEAGCNEFLIKPITKRALFEAIFRVLSNQ